MKTTSFQSNGIWPRPGNGLRKSGWLACTVAILGVSSMAQVPPPTVSVAGLWTGDVVIKHVGHARTGAIDPTQGEAQLRLLLHSDATGKVRLLKEVILGRPVEPGADVLLFTAPERMLGKPVARNVKNAAFAQRIATVAYDFKDTDGTDDNALDLTGSLANGQVITGTLQLDPKHPTNPFRHKFHADHANEGVKAFEIFRDIKITVSEAPSTKDGVLTLSAQFEETLRGLHRANLIVQGTVQLTRISPATTLNP